MADGLEVFSALLGPTLSSKNGPVDTATALKGKAVVGLFFSANWCPPCQGFVPKLADTYRRIAEATALKGSGGASSEFEVVFVSSCRDAESFEAFFGPMPWLALPFNDRARKAALSTQFGIKGLPTLVLVDGATGAVLTDDGRGEVARDPTGASFPWGAPPGRHHAPASAPPGQGWRGAWRRWLLALGAVAALLVAGAAVRPKPRTPAASLPLRCHARTPLPGGPGSPLEPVAEVYQGVTYDIVGGFQGVGQKEFDLVVFGATGFTGQLVAHYLAESFDPSFKWAIAGRSQAKLDALHESLGPLVAAAVGVIVVDATDRPSLQALARRTRVVISTAGPFTDFGAPLVRACAESGVHYADLSGEPFWQRAMVDEYDTTARQTGAKIVLAAGYDSVPFDLGVLHATRALQQRRGQPAAAVTALVTESRGWLSGGTLQSGLRTVAAMRTATGARLAHDPYLLVPQDDAGVVGACRADAGVSGWGSSVLPRYDPDHRALGVAHFMAAINARIVRRSMALRGERNVTYGEGIALTALADAAAFLAQKVWAGDMPVDDLWPAPGRGPSPAVMQDGRGAVAFVARASSGAFVRTEVSFAGDMGYNATAKMLAEAGRCLAAPNCHHDAAGVAGGGVTTPSAAMGLGLARRLAAASKGHFMAFRTLDEGPGPA